MTIFDLINILISHVRPKNKAKYFKEMCKKITTDTDISIPFEEDDETSIRRKIFSKNNKRKVHEFVHLLEKIQYSKFIKFLKEEITEEQWYQIENTIRTNYLPKFAIDDDPYKEFESLFEHLLRNNIFQNTFNPTDYHNPSNIKIDETIHSLGTKCYYSRAKNCIFMGNEEIYLSKELAMPEVPSSDESKYISELLLAYADAQKLPLSEPPKMLKLESRYQQDYLEQRGYYYGALNVCRIIRESFSDPDFQIREYKEDAYEFIKETYNSEYTNGYERLNTVLSRIVDYNTESLPALVKNLIKYKDKKGFCHILVNDGKIKWVRK